MQHEGTMLTEEGGRYFAHVCVSSKASQIACPKQCLRGRWKSIPLIPLS